MGEKDAPAFGIMDLRPPVGLLKLPGVYLSCLKATMSCRLLGRGLRAAYGGLEAA